jgi:general secretion pathway protein E
VPDWQARLLARLPASATAAAAPAAAPAAATGCSACAGTGFRGRTAVAEVLVMDEAVRALVVARAPPAEIARAAAAAGMVDLFQDGLTKVAAGLTTVEEVLRVGREAA